MMGRDGSRSVAMPIHLASRTDHVVALAALVALAAAEFLIALTDPRPGLILYSLLLVALMRQAARWWDRPVHALFVALTLVPLIRLIGLAVSLATIPPSLWSLGISGPLLVAVIYAARALGQSRTDLGLNLRWLPVQLLVALSGLGLGWLEYILLQPAGPLQTGAWHQSVLLLSIALAGAAFVEELIFRGLMQRSATDLLGRFGIIYVATLAAILQVGHFSPLLVIFTFVVMIYFGWVVHLTGSIVGVTLAHGLTNGLALLWLPLLRSAPG